MKIASRILLIIGGALMLWAVATNLYDIFMWPSLLFYLLTGIFALVACGVKKRGALTVALIFGWMMGSWFIIIGAILGLIYVMINGYRNAFGGFRCSKLRIFGEILLYLSGLLALSTALSLVIDAVLLFTLGVGGVLDGVILYGLYLYLSPLLPTLQANLDAIANGTMGIEEIFAVLGDPAYIQTWFQTFITDPVTIFAIIDIVVVIAVGIWCLWQALLTFILSILAMKAGNGKDHGKGIYIAVIIFAVFTWSLLPMVGAILALIAVSKEQKVVVERPAIAYRG